MPHNWPREIPGDTLQAAVYARLTGDTAHTVVDYVPTDTEYPYISFGPALDSTLDTISAYGTEVQLPMHVWTGPGRSSHEAGWKELNDIVNDVISSLIDGSRLLNVAGWYLYDALLAGPVRRYQEPDGIRHAVIPLSYRLTQG